MSDDPTDDVDDLLRRTMKVLDDQVPAGYFEALPLRTLARLEDTSMHTTPGTEDSASTGLPPITPMSSMTKDREEDSGLHDIRSLASSTKARLSSRRSTVNPVMREEDVLATSSAGWKAVALPEPAKMVSLPELSSLPSKAEIEAQDRAARQALKADAKAAATVASSDGAPAVEAPAAFGARIAAQQAGSKNKTLALVGIGLAAAAGVGVFVMSGGDKAATPAAAPVARAPTELPTMTAKQLPPPAPAAEVPSTAAPVVAAVEPVPAAPEGKVDAKATKPKDDDTKDKVHKVEIRDTMAKPDAPDKAADKPKDAPKAAGSASGDEEPSFDALLKEAGVDGQKKDAKVSLDKKSLSGGDIKTGMGSVAGKAQACYAGTQGTASVKLTVAPSGQVQKVTVGGPFAGTPVASCVEAAVKSASFPPWDGGPQTISYSYLLAE